TEQRRVERQLRQAQKMEAVGQLTGGIAHDFNNQLAVVIGNLELALETDDAGHRSRQMRTAMRAAQRSAELTRRLLTFSRQQLLSPTRAEPGRIITGLQDMLSRPL